MARADAAEAAARAGAPEGAADAAAEAEADWIEWGESLPLSTTR
jgi:hypothetical protein